MPQTKQKPGTKKSRARNRASVIVMEKRPDHVYKKLVSLDSFLRHLASLITLAQKITEDLKSVAAS